MANYEAGPSQEVKNRVFGGLQYDIKEREELFNRFIDRFIKLNSVEPESFKQFVVHMNKVPDRKIKKLNNTVSKKRLTYWQRKELGLYTLGKKSLSYKDLLPLHRLWKDYMTKYMDLEGLRSQNWSNTHLDPNFEQVSLKLYRADYHGSKVNVIRSTCPGYVGKSGIVAMETKNCFKLLGRDNLIRTIPKSACVFQFKLEEFEFTFFGKNFQIRPAERSTKKIKTVYLSDL